MKFSVLCWFSGAHLIAGVTCLVFFKVLVLALVGFPVVPAVIVMQKVSFIEGAVNAPRDQYSLV